MVCTLFFDFDRNNKKVINKYPQEIERGDVIWSHLLREEDNVIETVLNEIGETQKFEESLIEAQRPRYSNFKKFLVIVMSFPTNDTLYSNEENLSMFQISFIVMKNKIISISERENKMITRLMRKASRKKHKLEVSELLSSVIEEITNESVEIISDYDFEIEKLEKKIMQGSKREFEKSQAMKENLFYLLKTMKANAEVMRIIESDKNKIIDNRTINPNIKNRLLYCADMIEKNRENLTSLTNIYLSVLSHRLNEYVHKLTIIGAILMIPTIISGLFGMNVPLPKISFWEIVLMCLLISISMLVYFKAKKWI